MAAIDFASQSIGLKGVMNARDLGGIVMPDGRRVRKGLLLRGAALATAAPGDLELLRDKYRVAHVFDFRMERERKHLPDPAIEGADNVWLPTMDPNSGEVRDDFIQPGLGGFIKFVTDNASNPLVQQLASRIYTSMVVNEYSQLQYAAFMQQIMSTPPDRAVYWHCSQGKDRTGLGAMFILAALGADRRTILDDFEISNEFYASDIEAYRKQILAAGGSDAELDVVQTFVGVSTRHFVDALDLIDLQFGSLASYLENQLLLSPSDLSLLRARYLE